LENASREREPLWRGHYQQLHDGWLRAQLRPQEDLPVSVLESKRVSQFA
jgi:hypothetical protein